jgi:predicted membrane protein (TIGR00267 family)
VKRIDRYRELARISHSGAIARRYFATNAFDGTLTIMGLILGSYFSLVLNPITVLRAGIGVCVAMMFSGFAGTYFAERQIQHEQLQELEKAMLRKLEKTLPSRASFYVILLAVLVDGMAPFITGIICLVPIFFTVFGLIVWPLAILISVAIGLITIFVLGYYIGRGARTNPWAHGFQTLITGIGTAIVIILIQLTI